MRCFVLFLVACSSVASAQLGRWQLGNPSLILDLPGAPTSGGVAWHSPGTFSILPTSWSGEDPDLRVEVAEVFGSEAMEALANSIGSKFGQTVEGFAKGQISGYPALRFTVAKRPGLAIDAGGRTWVILATPKTPAGANMAAQVMRGIAVERSGEKRWVRRSLGNTRMNADLPFELASEPSEDPNRSEFELHFDDFRIDASVSQVSEGKVLDYEGTIKTYIEREKQGSTDFTSKRERLKRDELDGDLVTLDMKRGTKAYHVVTFFGKDEGGKLLRMDLSGRQGNAAHDRYIARIVDSLRVSTVNLSGFAPRQVGSEGIWFDATKEFESTGTDTYGVFGGAFAIDVRITKTDPATGHNPDQLMSFLEIKLKNAKEGKDFKSEHSKRIIDGMEARLLKVTYKYGGQSNLTMSYALAIFLPGRIVVAEMITVEEQQAYLDRILDTVRVELPAPAGWIRQVAGDSGISILAKKFELNRVKATDADKDSVVEITADDTGLMAIISEFKYKASAPEPGILMAEMFAGAAKAIGAKGKITGQRPAEIGNHSGIIATCEMDTARGMFYGDVVVLRRGAYAWILFTLINPTTEGAAAKRAALIASIR